MDMDETLGQLQAIHLLFDITHSHDDLANIPKAFARLQLLQTHGMTDH